jgi:hypothetical protein
VTVRAECKELEMTSFVAERKDLGLLMDEKQGLENRLALEMHFFPKPEK